MFWTAVILNQVLYHVVLKRLFSVRTRTMKHYAMAGAAVVAIIAVSVAFETKDRPLNLFQTLEVPRYASRQDIKVRAA